MTQRLEDQIRRYTEAVDGTAPPIEELLPAGMAEELGLDPTEIQVTTTLTPPKERRPMPGWVSGVLAAAAVIILLVPVWLWLGSGSQDFAEITPTTIAMPTTIPTPTTVPGTAAAPALTWDRSSATISGTGWEADSTVTLTLGDQELSAGTDSVGRFVLPSTSLPECCFDLLVVSDGNSTVTVELPALEIVRVDPERDAVAGRSSPNQEVQLRILGPDPYETSVSSADGAWVVDVAGEYDILPGMVVEIWVEYPDLTVRYSSGTLIQPSMGFRPDLDRVEVGGFRPLSPVTVAVDGTDLPRQVLTDASGNHSIELEQYGVDLRAGSLVSATDGISTLQTVVPALTYDFFDAETGVASGTSNMPDGTGVQVEFWIGPRGADEANDYVAVELTVSDGVWETKVEPMSSGLEIFSTNVTAWDEDYWTQVEYDGPLT